MLIPIFQQAKESGPKHCSCQLRLDWHQIDIVKQATPTFWYNRTNDGKSAKFGTNEVDIIWNKNGNIHDACSTHTYIFYLLRQDSVQLKN